MLSGSPIPRGALLNGTETTVALARTSRGWDDIPATDSPARTDRTLAVFCAPMTSDLPHDELTDPEDFERTLGRVLLAALAANVDPWGSWVYRTDGSDPDLEVMVVELDDHSESEQS